MALTRSILQSLVVGNDLICMEGLRRKLGHGLEPGTGIAVVGNDLICMEGLRPKMGLFEDWTAIAILVGNDLICMEGLRRTKMCRKDLEDAVQLSEMT